MYVILTTFPEEGSGNIGDKLITESAIELLRALKGEEEFLTLFRGTSLSPWLNQVNGARAVVMPGFAIREPMHPDTYRLVPDLRALRVPLVPLGAGTKLFPGDFVHVNNFRYSRETAGFLRRIDDTELPFSCREFYTCRLLERHGIHETRMVGDCAWYDLGSIGKPMKRPTKIDRVVFTTPHQPLFVQQARAILALLAELFPTAQRYISLQSRRGAVEGELVPHAVQLGFEIVDAEHELDRIAFYETCDLHVGYRVHGHLAFLRKRVPSVLLAEDSRGLGFIHTMGGGGLPAADARDAKLTERTLRAIRRVRRTGARRALKRTIEPQRGGNPRTAVVDELRGLLQEELSSAFRRYAPVAAYIDEVFEQEMKPFIEELP